MYISQERFERLYEADIRLVTELRKDMKDKLMGMRDEMVLWKWVEESVNDLVKEACQVEHSSIGAYIILLWMYWRLYGHRVSCCIHRPFMLLVMRGLC